MAVATALAVVVASCGGGDGDPEGVAPPDVAAPGEGGPGAGAVVESPDGRASLTLAPDSLPDGVTVDDISIDVAFNDAPDEGVPFAAVSLAPDGLVLEAPGALTISQTSPGEGALIVVHSSGDRIAFLPAQIDVSENEATLTTSIDHFSVVFFMYLPAFTASTTLTQRDVEVHQSLTAGVTVTRNDEQFSVWVALPEDEAGTARLVTMTPPPSPTITDARLFWDSRQKTGFWDPEVSNLELVPTDTGWESSASARCLKVNSTTPHHDVSFRAQMSLISVGEPESIALIGFPFPGSSSGSPSVVEQTDDAFGDLFPILQMAPGDRFTAWFSMNDALLSLLNEIRCVAPGTGSTTSSTSGSGDGDTPPPDDPQTLIAGGVEAVIDDPEGDFTAAEDLESRGFVPEQEPPDGLDITNVQIVYAPGGTRTIITVTFKGPLREVEAEDGRSVSIRAVFRKDGSYDFETQYLQGSAFVSGGPEGSGVTVEWLSNNRFRFILDGHAPAPGDQVRIEVLSRKKVGDDSEASEDQATVDITE